MSDTVTLTWRKNRWLVTSCENITNESTVKLKDVRDAYAAALEATDGDIAQAVGILRARFAWLPTDAELACAAESVHKYRYASDAARVYMEAQEQ